MKIKAQTLNVLMNGILVGSLTKAKNASLTFSYDPAWLTTLGARPISLSLPLIDQPFTGDVVYNFFDNLLPDNAQIRARIQAKFQITTNHPFDLLASIGKDCVGAIQLVADPLLVLKKEITYIPVTAKEIAAILRGEQNYPLGMQGLDDEFRISIAGAQEKTAFLYHNGKWNKPRGTTPTTHIFKLPIGIIQHAQMDLTDSCENEWLCAQIAAAFGLPVAKCKILYFGKVKVLVVERFDRKLSRDKTWLMRLPQEDICQALGISSYLKYQGDGGPGIKEIMQLLSGSQNAAEDRDIFYRSQILFWLLAAIDGHAKNFSVFIEPEGQYRLTPLYDIMSAHPLISKKQLQTKKIKMAMALQGKNNHYHWHSVQRRYFLTMAQLAHYSVNKAEIALDTMLGQVEPVIAQVSANLPARFPSAIAETIFAGMRLVQRKLAAH